MEKTLQNATDVTAMIVGNGFAVAAIVGATIMVINNTIKRDATELLRPIAPPLIPLKMC